MDPGGREDEPSLLRTKEFPYSDFLQFCLLSISASESQELVSISGSSVLNPPGSRSYPVRAHQRRMLQPTVLDLNCRENIEDTDDEGEIVRSSEGAGSALSKFKSSSGDKIPLPYKPKAIKAKVELHETVLTSSGFQATELPYRKNSGSTVAALQNQAIAGESNTAPAGILAFNPKGAFKIHTPSRAKCSNLTSASFHQSQAVAINSSQQGGYYILAPPPVSSASISHLLDTSDGHQGLNASKKAELGQPSTSLQHRLMAPVALGSAPSTNADLPPPTLSSNHLLVSAHQKPPLVRVKSPASASIPASISSGSLSKNSFLAHGSNAVSYGQPNELKNVSL